MTNQFEEQESNRVAKERLCEEAEALMSSTTWKEAAERFKEMQQEWRQIGHVPFADAELLQQRFRSACDAFFENRTRNFQAQELERIDNFYRKSELCEKAEALVDAEDLQQAHEEMQELFQEWKSIGPVPREKSDAIWERFRSAQDQLYQRKRQQFELLDKEREENLRVKEQLCLEAEALAMHEETSDYVQTMIDLQERWKGVGPVPRERSDEIWNRFRTACDTFFLKRNDQLNILDETRLVNLAKREQICREARELKDSVDWQIVTARYKELQAEWKSAWPVPRDEGEEMWEEFRNACDHFFERKRVHFEEKRKEWQKNQAVWRMNMEKVIVRKEEEITRIEAALEFEKSHIAEWMARLENLPAELKSIDMKMEIEEKIEKAKDEMERKNALIAQLEADISNIKQKLEKE